MLFGKMIKLILSLVITITMMTSNAQAALKAVGPTSLITSIPIWYQDTNNLALMPCLDQNGFCLLPPPFDALTVPTSPITTTGPITNANLPSEGFYFSAQSILPIEASGELANLTFVLEYAFLSGVIPEAGITFLRTDLQKMRNLSPNSIYRVTHPYGTFEFSTDGAGDTINGGGAIRTEDGSGTAANYLPPLMKSALSTNMGPFLTRASGGLLLDPLSGNTYIGDAVTPVAVAGSPNNTNYFKIERLNASGVPIGAGATWQTNLFTLMGKVFTGQIPSPMSIDRTTYARDANTGQVDIFATALPAATITLSGTGISPTIMTQDTPSTGKFFLDIPLGNSSLPTGLTVANSMDAPSIPYPITLVDEVNISEANYNQVTKILTIKASSRDKVALPTLTVSGFAIPNTLDANGVFTKTLTTTIPPQNITVTSSRGGSATAPVSVGVPPVSLVVANNDTAAISVGNQVIINVIGNDSSATSALNPSSLTVSAATGGNVSANLDGTVTYTAPSTVGSYSFTYTVKDSLVNPVTSNVATVTVTVTNGTSAVISSPADASTLTGGSVSFSWNNAGASNYQFRVGTSPGAFDVALANLPGNITNTIVNNLPVNGSSLFVRLYSQIGTTWLFNDYTYTAATGSSPAATITSPAAGTIFTGSSVSFVWNNAGANNYQFRVGTSPGAFDIALENLPGTATNTTVTALPVNGSTLYVRLYSQIGLTWLYNDYTYTAGTLSLIPATISSPVNASTLAGSSQTFTWNNAGANNYQFRVGTSPGAFDLALANLSGSSTNTSVTGLPINGSTLYVRLYSQMGSTWLSNDYTYISGP